jgi:exopolysaccharide biosynthesis polyprenyl glycosylphosphotransferase
MAGNQISLGVLDASVEVVLPKYTRRNKIILDILLVGIDTVMLMLAFIFGYYAREVLPFFPQPESQPPLGQYFPIIVLQVITILALFYFSRMYHQQRSISRFDQIRVIIGVVTLGVLLTNGTQELLFRNSFLDVAFPRSLFFYIWIFSVICAVLGRELHRILQNQARRRGWANDNLLIVGSGKIARDMAGRIKTSPELGYNVVGVVTSKDEHQGRMLGIPVLGNYPDLPHIIDTCNIQQVIIALPDAKRGDLVELVTLCQRGQVDIKIYPDIFAYMAGDLNVDDLGGTPLLTVRDIALRGWRLSLKRGLDIFGAFVGLIFLSPLFLLTALIIRLESKGSIFYTQQRMGLDGRSFPMIKFRSMRPDAEAEGPGWTIENDPRVTRFGKFLRSSNWDEIPQLINVLLGHMSLVGPRPERPVYVQRFRDQIPRYMERHREKGGMTGWAQVNGLRGDTSIPQRITHDLWYVEHWSMWLDLKIIFMTIWQTIFGASKNAY